MGADETCTACGATLGLGAAFCPSCGTPQPSDRDTLTASATATATRHTSPVAVAGAVIGAVAVLGIGVGVLLSRGIAEDSERTTTSSSRPSSTSESTPAPASSTSGSIADQATTPAPTPLAPCSTEILRFAPVTGYPETAAAQLACSGEWVVGTLLEGTYSYVTVWRSDSTSLDEEARWDSRSPIPTDLDPEAQRVTKEYLASPEGAFDVCSSVNSAIDAAGLRPQVDPYEFIYAKSSGGVLQVTWWRSGEGIEPIRVIRFDGSSTPDVTTYDAFTPEWEELDGALVAGFPCETESSAPPIVVIPGA